MSSVIISGDTSGAVTLAAPAVAGTTTLTLPATTGSVIGSNSSGDIQFNSGYGSVAKAYGVRAWVNFNGTGTVAIRASGNVSSITDNGTGDYSINFSTAMPDANYAPIASVEETGIIVVTSANQSFQQTASAARIKVCLGTSSTGYDADQVNVAIFR